jgi:hypothetical protein
MIAERASLYRFLEGKACNCTRITSEQHQKNLEGFTLQLARIPSFLQACSLGNKRSIRIQVVRTRVHFSTSVRRPRQLSAMILQAISAFRTLVQKMHRLPIAEETMGIWALDITTTGSCAKTPGYFRLLFRLGFPSEQSRSYLITKLFLDMVTRLTSASLHLGQFNPPRI